MWVKYREVRNFLFLFSKKENLAVKLNVGLGGVGCGVVIEILQLRR